MTQNDLAHVLAIGLTTFTLSVLPPTTVQAECWWVERHSGNACPPGQQVFVERKVEDKMTVLCCTPGTTQDDYESYLPKRTSQTQFKPMGRSNAGCAKNDVDVYDSPVEPRKVTGMMPGGTPGKITERHPHGWVKISGYGWIANNHFGKCPG